MRALLSLPFTSRSMRLAFLLVLTLVALASSLPLMAEGGEMASDPKAVAIAEHSLEAMGGQEAWDATRFLRFDFFGFRLHHWDRHQGMHRLEGKTREGVAYVVVHSLDTREGKVWLDGKLQEGEEKAKWLEQAYGAWVNDAYWLVMPYKLLDPGVNLEYDGSEELDGATFDKLKLTFNGVGLTPGDTYWAYINRESGLMERWAYFLQDWEDDREATHWQWLDWQRHGQVMLSSKRLNPDPENGREAMLSDLAVLDYLPDSVFTSPDPVAAE